MLTEYKNYLSIFLLTFTLVFSGCRPDPVSPTQELKSMPVARAGNDIRVYLPMEREIKLNGSGSYDPDGAGRPMIYRWTKLSGPEVYNFRSDIPSPTVTVFETGKYVFELKVEDVQNNVARDTVTVDAVWGLGCDPNIVYEKAGYELAYPLTVPVPLDVSIGIGTNYIVFAGGRTEQNDGWGGGDVYDSSIYVFDPANNTTFKSQLSVARAGIGIAIAGKDVFMAGGIVDYSVTDAVDILDLNTRTLKKAKLSVARSSVTTVVSGHLVFFAGGRDLNNKGLDVVDIYDLNSGTWSVAKLSIARAGMGAAASGTKVIFAGGELSSGSRSNRVDVYDINSGIWTTALLPTSKSNISAAVLGDEIVLDGGTGGFAGGGISNEIDFLDPATMRFRKECMLSREYKGMEFGQNLNSLVIGNNLYYLGTKVISRYTKGGSKWAMTFPNAELDLFALYSSGGQVYGLSRMIDVNNGYMMGVKMMKINF